jgi:hypothetical protein
MLGFLASVRRSGISISMSALRIAYTALPRSAMILKGAVMPSCWDRVAKYIYISASAALLTTGGCVDYSDQPFAIPKL